MNKQGKYVLGFAALVICAGCTSYESARISGSSSSDMTDVLEQEIVDNLIRARNALPFVHYDVYQIQSIAGQNFTPKITAGRTDVANRTLPRGTTTNRNALGIVTGMTTVVGTAGGLLGTVTKPFGIDVSGTRNNQATITTSPVLKEPDTYFAYTEFLNAPKRHYEDKTGAWIPDWEEPKPEDEKKKSPKTAATETKLSTLDTKTEVTVTKDASGAKQSVVEKSTADTVEIPKDKAPSAKPEVRLNFKYLDYHPPGWISSLEKGKRAPDSGDYIPHTLRRWEGSYYWVPVAYRQEFSDLCLAVVARGTLIAAKSRYGKPVQNGAISRGATIIVNPGPSDVEKALNLQNLELNNLNSTFRSLIQ